MNKRILQIANIIAFLATIIVNWLANALPIGGYNTGVLSDMYPNLFVPAGITFSIWGVIYLLLLGFNIYQARDLFKKDQKNDEFSEKISWLFVLSSLANIGWILAWHFRILWLSVIIMLGIFAALLAIYLRLGIGKGKTTLLEKIFVHIPFSVYLGWITVAIIANITALLVSIGWNGFGISESVWTIVMLSAAAVITLGMEFLRKDIAYALVIIWAFTGIIIKRTSSAFPPQPEIVTAAIVLIAIIGCAAAVQSVLKILKKAKTA